MDVAHVPPPEMNPNNIENTTNPVTSLTAAKQNMSTVIASVNMIFRLVTPYLGANAAGIMRPKMEEALMMESWMYIVSEV